MALDAELEPQRRLGIDRLRTIAKRCGGFFGVTAEASPLHVGMVLPLIQYRVESRRPPTRIGQNLWFDGLWHVQIQDTADVARHYAWVRVEPRRPVQVEATGGQRLARLVERTLRRTQRMQSEALNLTVFPGYAMAAIEICTRKGESRYIIADPPSYAGYDDSDASQARSLQCGSVVDADVIFEWLRTCPAAFGLDTRRQKSPKKERAT